MNDEPIAVVGRINYVSSRDRSIEILFSALLVGAGLFLATLAAVPSADDMEQFPTFVIGLGYLAYASFRSFHHVIAWTLFLDGRLELRCLAVGRHASAAEVQLSTEVDVELGVLYRLQLPTSARKLAMSQHAYKTLERALVDRPASV